jgi:hypothetical protein
MSNMQLDNSNLLYALINKTDLASRVLDLSCRRRGFDSRWDCQLKGLSLFGLAPIFVFVYFWVVTL